MANLCLLSLLPAGLQSVQLVSCLPLRSYPKLPARARCCWLTIEAEQSHSEGLGFRVGKGVEIVHQLVDASPPVHSGGNSARGSDLPKMAS